MTVKHRSSKDADPPRIEQPRPGPDAQRMLLEPTNRTDSWASWRLGRARAERHPGSCDQKHGQNEDAGHGSHNPRPCRLIPRGHSPSNTMTIAA